MTRSSSLPTARWDLQKSYSLKPLFGTTDNVYLCPVFESQPEAQLAGRVKVEFHRLR